MILTNDQVQKKLTDVVALNRKFGFVTEIRIKPTFTSESNLHFFSLKVNTNFKKGTDWGNSIQFDEGLALLIAFYESVERYFASLYDRDSLIYCSQAGLDKDKLELSVITNNSSLHGIDISNKPLYWTEVEDQLHHRKIWIPAQLVFLPFEVSDDFVIREHISTGLACGDSKLEAVISGILECIERDNLTVTFLTKEKPPRINGYESGLTALLRNHNLKPHLFKLNREREFHSILCLLEDITKQNPPAITTGCACGFNIKDAIASAMLESVKASLWIKGEIHASPQRFTAAQDISAARMSLIDKAFFWAHPANTERLSFLTRDNQSLALDDFSNESPPNNAQQKFDILEAWIRNNGFSLYVKEFGDKDLNDKSLFVTRVVIPELHPLYLNENWRYDIGPRLTRPAINSDPLPFL